jgi:hypothetical protein
VALAAVAASASASVTGEKDAVMMSPICKALKAASEAANKKSVSPMKLFLGEEDEEGGGGGAAEGAAKGVFKRVAEGGGGGGGGDEGADGGGVESNTHDRAEGSMGTRKRGRVVEEQQQQQQQQQQEEGVQKRGRGRPKKRNVVSL